MLLCASCQHFCVLDLSFPGPGNILEKGHKSMKEKIACSGSGTEGTSASTYNQSVNIAGADKSSAQKRHLDIFRLTMIIFICVGGGIYSSERRNSLHLMPSFDFYIDPYKHC